MRNRLNESIDRIQKIMYSATINEQAIGNAIGFYELVQIIITEVEGGYYHPDMLKDGRIKDTRYGSSGETMFGIDKLNGVEYNKMSEGQEFWGIIDKAGARTKWPHNYMGGEYEGKLRTLTATMIQKEFNRLLSIYIKDENVRALVLSSAALTFNFIYATYNGMGYFNNMSKLLIDNYNNKITDVNTLIQNQINYRLTHTNSLIRGSGETIKKIIDKNGFTTKSFLVQDKYDVKQEVDRASAEFINNTFNAAINKPSGEPE